MQRDPRTRCTQQSGHTLVGGYIRKGPRAGGMEKMKISMSHRSKGRRFEHSVALVAAAAAVSNIQLHSSSSPVRGSLRNQRQIS